MANTILGDTLLQFLQCLHEPGTIIELRTIDKHKGKIQSGYYDNFEALIQEAVKLDGSVDGLYITAHQINPYAISTELNQNPVFKNKTTSNSDISHYNCLFIDIDPVRNSDTPSNEEEKNAAIELAYKIREFLFELDWPEPVIGMSGNGSCLRANMVNKAT